MAKKRTTYYIDVDLLEKAQEKFGNSYSQSGLIEALLKSVIECDVTAISQINKKAQEVTQALNQATASCNTMARTLIEEAKIDEQKTLEQVETEKNLALDILDWKKLITDTKTPYASQAQAKLFKEKILIHYAIDDVKFADLAGLGGMAGLSVSLEPKEEELSLEFENINKLVDALEPKRKLFLDLIEKKTEKADKRIQHLLFVCKKEFNKFGLSEEQALAWLETGQLPEGVEQHGEN